MGCFDDLIENIRIRFAKRWIKKQKARHGLFQEYF